MAAPEMVEDNGSVANESQQSDEGPSLGELWEDCRQIRERLRDNGGRLVQWPSAELVNKPTMAGIAMNCHALRILAAWWCPQQKKAKSPSVHELKKQVGQQTQRGRLSLPVPVYAEQMIIPASPDRSTSSVLNVRSHKTRVLYMQMHGASRSCSPMVSARVGLTSCMLKGALCAGLLGCNGLYDRVADSAFCVLVQHDGSTIIRSILYVALLRIRV